MSVFFRLAVTSLVAVTFASVCAVSTPSSATAETTGVSPAEAGEGAPMFSEYANVAAGVKGDAPALVDVNGDGRLDVVIVPGGSSTFNVVLNLEGTNGDPSFTDLPANPVGLPGRRHQQRPDRARDARLQQRRSHGPLPDQPGPGEPGAEESAPADRCPTAASDSTCGRRTSGRATTAAAPTGSPSTTVTAPSGPGRTSTPTATATPVPRCSPTSTATATPT